MELPTLVDVENDISDIHSFVSEEDRDALLKYGLSKEAYVLHNTAPPEFHKSLASTSGALEKIALVSNHPPAELLDLTRFLRNEGIIIDIYGEGNNYKRIEPSVLQDYDAVITIGKTVQYSLCLGIPVFVYDHFGGSGWINEDNFKSQLSHNFSGRDSRRRLTARELRLDLISGFAASRDFVLRNLYELRREFDLDNKLDELLGLAEFTHPSLKRLSEGQALRLKALVEQNRGLFRSLRYTESLLQKMDEGNKGAGEISTRIRSKTLDSAILLIVIRRPGFEKSDLQRAMTSVKAQVIPFQRIALIELDDIPTKLDVSFASTLGKEPRLSHHQSSASLGQVITTVKSVLEEATEDYVVFLDGTSILHADFNRLALSVLCDSDSWWVSVDPMIVWVAFNYGASHEVDLKLSTIESPNEISDPFSFWESPFFGMNASMFSIEAIVNDHPLILGSQGTEIREYLWRILRYRHVATSDQRRELQNVATVFKSTSPDKDSSHLSANVSKLIRERSLAQLTDNQHILVDFMSQKIAGLGERLDFLSHELKTVETAVLQELEKINVGLEARILGYLRRLPLRFINKFNRWVKK
jgi:hypothetical protein